MRQTSRKGFWSYENMLMALLCLDFGIVFLEWIICACALIAGVLSLLLKEAAPIKVGNAKWAEFQPRI